MGGGKKKGKAPPEPQEAEDFMGGLSLLETDVNDWSSPRGPTGWGATSIQEVEDEDEDDEDEDEDEDEEEEEDEPVPRKGRKQQSQNQQQSQNHHHNPKQSGKGPQKQKGHQGNQSRPGPQSGQRNNNPHRSQEKTQQQKQPQNQKAHGNQKGKQGSKPQKQHQEPPVEGPEWGVKEGGYGGWNPGGSSVGSVSGGGGEWGMSRNQPTQHQQYRLASLLEDIPEERGRTRGSNQQGPKKQGRVPTPAEHVSAAASGNVPSRTLFYAVSNSAVSVLDGGASDGQHAPIQIYTSGGAALASANRALYSHERPASQRIHWLFNPRKDIKVASLLDWIQGMSHGLATLGLHDFLETQQRGALVANADYRTVKPSGAEPAFDWLTFDDVIATHDKILQESMAFYEPDNEVLVFVFLLSRSGNSLAMWRRKLPVPIAIRNPNRREITRIMNSLARRKYVVTVDELPPPPPPQPKSKKKWFPW